MMRDKKEGSTTSASVPTASAEASGVGSMAIGAAIMSGWRSIDGCSHEGGSEDSEDACGGTYTSVHVPTSSSAVASGDGAVAIGSIIVTDRSRIGGNVLRVGSDGVIAPLVHPHKEFGPLQKVNIDDFLAAAELYLRQVGSTTYKSAYAQYACFEN